MNTEINPDVNFDIITKVREDLLKNADEKTKESSKRFFKEEVHVHGVKSAQVRAIAKRHFKEVKNLDKPELFAICEEFLKSDYGEEAFIAFEWAYSMSKRFEPDDFQTFERWIADYVNNWAKCDTLCNHSIGDFIERYPEYLQNLKTWAKSDNRWLRRASAVSLILPARKGDFLQDVFEISDILLLDQDDMVQKGYGWMLKEASKKHQPEVFEYVMKHKHEMPRTALRYAIEKMPQELKRQAMAR